MEFFIYILYSASSGKYYVGHTNNIERRVYEHNNPISNKYTSSSIPWELKISFSVSNDRGEAMKIEKYIKKQKSKIFIEKLIASKEECFKLAQMVRVPMNRD